MADFDFIRLTFDGKTTTDFNLYVVSNSDRYNISLSPNFENRTTSIPGRPGLIYWGTDLQAQEFPIYLATDGMTGTQLNAFRKHFVPKKIGKLSFEESFYKYYNVILNSPPSLSFVPFSHKGETIYKGEVELNFTSLEPYAYSDLYLGTGYTTNLNYKESGLPILSSFPTTGNVIFHIASGKKVKNGALTTGETSGLTDIVMYHAGSAEAATKFSTEKVLTLSAESGVTPPFSSWTNLEIGPGRLVKPRFIIDIEFALRIVYENFGSLAIWTAAKEEVLNILREELDGPAKTSIINLVSKAGTGTIVDTFAKLRGKFVEGFFTGVKYRFVLNGITNQCLLEVTGAKSYNAALTGTAATYREDNAGSFNGKFVTLDPSGILPVSTGKQTIQISSLLNKVEVDFQNTYI